MHLHLKFIFKISLQIYFPSFLHPPHFSKTHSIQQNYLLCHSNKPNGRRSYLWPHAEVMSPLSAFWTSEDNSRQSPKRIIFLPKEGESQLPHWAMTHTFCTLCRVGCTLPRHSYDASFYIFKTSSRFFLSHCPQKKGRFGDMTSPGKLNYGFFFWRRILMCSRHEGSSAAWAFSFSIVWGGIPWMFRMVFRIENIDSSMIN